MVHITQGNTKIGRTANISLPPIIGCVNSDLCAVDCYAVKFYKMYPDCRDAWDENLAILNCDPDMYFESVRRYLLRHQPAYFRWHVSGDIQNQAYLEKMKEIARDYSAVLFVVFTKHYSLCFDRIPPNLSIVISAWPGLWLPDLSLPIAFVKSCKEHRAVDYITCPGNCESCRVCWNLKELNKNVLLSKH